MKILVTALIFLVFTANSSVAQDLAGTVKDRQGIPLANVLVYSYPTVLPNSSELSPYQYTNKHGFFRFRHPGKVLFFIRNGYRPNIYRPIIGNNRVDVVLEDASESEWVISSCHRITGDLKYFGTNLKVILPSEMRLLQEKSPDSASTTIEYRTIDKINRLTIWMSVSGGDLPNEKLILSTVKLFTRAVRNKDNYGTEFRGESVDGRCWRQVRFGFYTYTYENVSKEAAQYFDRIVDSLCIG